MKIRLNLRIPEQTKNLLRLLSAGKQRTMTCQIETMIEAEYDKMVLAKREAEDSYMRNR